MYLFQFFHEVDIERVIDMSPLTFDQRILLFKRLELHAQATRVLLIHTLIWVQVYDLPLGFISKRVATSIGNYIRQFSLLIHPVLPLFGEHICVFGFV